MDIEKVRQFIGDTRVQYCSRLGVRDNFFDIVGLNENGHSDVLAWLLNPRESHNIGDFFFHELLRQILKFYGESEGIIREKLESNDFFDVWGVAEIEEASFQNSLVIEREFILGDSSRIDLLMVDHYHKLVVALENKYGSVEHSGQLDRYFRLLNEEHFEGYDVVYVYLDPDANERLDNGAPKFNHWVGLNYEWIENFCERIVDRDMLPEKANSFVKDYLQYLSGEEFGGDAFNEMEDYVSDLLAEYGDLMESFDECEIQVKGKGRVELVGPPVVKLAEYVPLIENEDDLQVTKVYLKYYNLIDHLISSTKTSYFEKSITEKCPGYDLGFDARDNFFGVYNLSWKRFANDLAESEESWCIYVGFDFVEEDGERSPTIKIWVHGKYIKAEFSDAIFIVFQREFDFTRKRFSDGCNTVKITEAIKDEAEAIDKLVAVVQKLSQVLQTV